MFPGSEGSVELKRGHKQLKPKSMKEIVEELWKTKKKKIVSKISFLICNTRI